jgi:hypothetical protein
MKWPQIRIEPRYSFPEILVIVAVIALASVFFWWLAFRAAETRHGE